MGSAFSTPCLGAGAGAAADLSFSGADETLGHSFCYLSNSAAAAGDHSSRFRSISGASVSANSATPPTVGLVQDLHRPFESTALFGVVPLLPAAAASGPLDRSAAAGFFLSGPIERGAVSGPLDSSTSSSIPFSGPLAAPATSRRRGRSLFRSFSVVPIRTFAAAGRKDHHHHRRHHRHHRQTNHRHWPAEFGENVQWAHGMAGEDRVQVVVSDDHRWLFVGIYDGFNGPDAPEFLMGNLYRSVFAELRGLLWVDQSPSKPSTSSSTLPPHPHHHPHRSPPQSSHLSAEHGLDSAKRVTFSSNRTASRRGKALWELLAEEAAEEEEDEGIDLSGSKRFAFHINCIHIPTKRRAPSFPNFRFVSSRDGGDRVPLGDGKERLGQSFRTYKAGPVDHDAVLRALSRGLAATEAAYLEMTDEFMDRNPELALMGSCLLVVLMRDEDVYVMNVGDSRAIVAQYHPQEMDSGACDAEGIVETMDCGDQAAVGLAALQLSTDHSTSIEEEVLRIKQEHPDDSRCIVNDRVKGRLMVTRAFGAGFLKQPKWNNGLLEMFRNDYVGTAPYLSCAPSLCHHKLGPNDQFLILSSDGLYQYLTNQEAVSYVESFMERFPDGDPAQHLIEELLLRAAKKAGMDFHQLLDIPQGDRRKYHDDVTVMVISLEGRIWKSSGKYL